MTTWRWGFTVGAITAAAVLGLASCGDDDDDGGGGTTTQQVDPDPLRLEIQSATFPEGGRPTVRFRVTDLAGNPIALEPELSTTAIPRLSRNPAFTIAMLDDTGDYVNYYQTTTQPRYADGAPSPDDYVFSPDPELFPSFVARPAAPRTQAQVPSFVRANLSNVGNSVYEYTLPTPTFTTGMDRTKTHTVAGFLARTNGIDTDNASGAFNFVPAGGTPQLDEVVTNAACNRCHGALTAHGARQNVQFCITCHSPQTGDPETDQTVDMKVMIHKIHYGSGLPSVAQSGNPQPYYIVGHNGSVADFSEVAFPWHDHGVQHCTVCHQGEDADNWKKKPTLATCTSCHDNVKFAAADAPPGAPFCNEAAAKGNNQKEDCVHVVQINVPAAEVNSTTLCIGCHGDTSAVAPIENFHHGD